MSIIGGCVAKCGNSGDTMVGQRVMRAVVSAVIASSLVTGWSAVAHAQPTTQVLVDSTNVPGATIESEGYVWWSQIKSGGPGPLFFFKSGFTATADTDISGVNLLASSNCASSCPDVQFYFVEENATGDGVITPPLDPSTPGYARVPDSALPRSPVADPLESYIAPLTVSFPVPLHVVAGHSYFLQVQDVGITGSGTHTNLGLVYGAAPSGEYVGWPSFPDPNFWRFAPCDGGCLAMQVFSGTAPVLPQPIPVTVKGGQYYGSSTPAFVLSGSAPSGVAGGGTVSCARVIGKPRTSIGPIDHTLPVDGYTIAASTCSGLSLTGPNASKYRVLYIGDAFRVDAVPLYVQADKATRPYGFDNPALTYKLSGFVNNEDASIVAGQPTLSTAATASSPAGVYPIDVDTAHASAQNYYLVGVGASLTVTRATPVITTPTMSISTATSAGRVQFSATLHNASLTGPAVVGVPVAFSAHSALGRMVKCTATTDAFGVATCTSHDVLGFAFVNPRSYTATVPNNLQNYIGAQAIGIIKS